MAALPSISTHAVVNLVKDTHPQLRKEFHPTLNRSIAFDSLRTNSRANVWWLCAKDPKHSWQADVWRRAVKGNGCPYCAGLKVLREASFAALFPNLLAGWHPTRNGKLDPWKIAPMSNRRIWWRCNSVHQHEWSTQVHSRTIYGSGCRQCHNLRNPLSQAAPLVAREWHPTLNGSLTPAGISANSRQRVWWICQNNPKHAWQASIYVRVRAKSGCPDCARLRPVTKLPALSIHNPALASQWHPTKNGTRLATEFSPNSSFKAWWICLANDQHVWRAMIRNRSVFGHGCPHCTPRTKFVSPGKSLADRFPDLAAQWHPTKNGPLKANEVLPGSSKRVWWQCNVNPQHVWDATITTRTHRRSRRRCPFCSGARVTSETSLSTCHPDIAKQWDHERNLPLTPETVKRASARNVWWICPKNSNHRWRALVKNRTLHHTGCPLCESEERVRRLQHVLIDSVNANVDYLKTFKVSMEALRLLAKRSMPQYRSLQATFNRMLYASAITALETYLSDAFIHNVIEDEALIRRLLSSAPELKERKYSLAEAYDLRVRAKEQISEYLLDIVWHNLAKVRQLYDSVLGISFPEDSDALHRAVAIRHDLIHRNGKTKTGLTHRFKQAEILAVFSVVELFVLSIDAQLKNRANAANA